MVVFFIDFLKVLTIVMYERYTSNTNFIFKCLIWHLAKTKYTLVSKQYKQWRFQFKLQESLGRFAVRACMPLGPEPISGYLKVSHKKPSVYYRQPEFGLISDSSTIKLQTTNNINNSVYVVSRFMLYLITIRNRSRIVYTQQTSHLFLFIKSNSLIKGKP